MITVISRFHQLHFRTRHHVSVTVYNSHEWLLNNCLSGFYWLLTVQHEPIITKQIPRRGGLCTCPACLRILRRQLRALNALGANDPFFTMEAVTCLQALLPGDETHIFDAGHFALATHAPEISATIRDVFDH